MHLCSWSFRIRVHVLPGLSCFYHVVSPLFFMYFCFPSLCLFCLYSHVLLGGDQLGENGGDPENEPGEDEKDGHGDAKDIAKTAVGMLAHDLAVVDQQKEEHDGRWH